MPEGPPVTVSVTGPLIFTDPEFTLRAALDGLGVVYMFEEHVADYSHAASSCGSSRTGGAGRAHMSCPQLDLSFGVIARGTDPCRQFSKQVALLAGHRTLIGSPPTTATASGHGPADHGAGRSSDTPPRHRS